MWQWFVTHHICLIITCKLPTLKLCAPCGTCIKHARIAHLRKAPKCFISSQYELNLPREWVILSCYRNFAHPLHISKNTMAICKLHFCINKLSSQWAKSFLYTYFFFIKSDYRNFHNCYSLFQTIILCC